MDDQRFAKTAALADRLGTLRARIRTLRDEESALRAEILRVQDGGVLTGARYEIRVRRGYRRSLNTDALPDAIRTDPRYWTVAETCTVVCRLRTAPVPPAPPDAHPVPRQRALPLPIPDDDPDDIVLIEPF